MPKRMHYQTGHDLKRVQEALMQWTQQVGDCNYWHKGDIGHHLFNGGYQLNPQDILYYWLDDTGQTIAFVNLYPHWESFILQVAPDMRHTDFHIEVFEWCEQATIDFANRNNKPIDKLYMEISRCDPQHEAFIQARGYTYDKHTMMLTEHDLQNLPDATLPEGFRFHDATSADLANLADVHNHSFTNKWNAELYGKVFNAPHIEYEIVVVAPDGHFAAFTNIWVDDVNQSILFEPVGTHSDFRRKGIAKAMMLYVMKRMQAEHNITHAFVCHELPEKNLASAKLYESLGFRPKYEIHEYVKSLTIS